jgi:hypothetical protein
VTPFAAVLRLGVREARRRVTRAIFAARAKSQRSLPLGDLSIVLWPPVTCAKTVEGLSMRLDWFLPMERVSSITIPASTELCSATDGLISSGQWASELQRADLVLDWKFASLRSFRLRSLLPKSFLIDPTWYYETEAREWTRIFHHVVQPETLQNLQRVSAANFAEWTARFANVGAVNVCGNGPGLEVIYSSHTLDQVHLICNAAVASDRLTTRLRPAALAFCDHYYFGPSDFAREFIGRVQACVERYDCFVLIPEGYAHWLLSTHYPSLRPRLIGLQGIAGPPMLEMPTHPTADSLGVKSVGNVVSDMLLPVAASLRPKAIRVWGCDGRVPGEQSLWSYLPELCRETAPAAAIHPAYFRDRIESERVSAARYQFHCDYMSTLCQYIEGLGIEVTSESPSHIPALRQRYRGSQTPAEALP